MSTLLSSQHLCTSYSSQMILLKSCVWEQWSISAVKLFYRAWQVSSPALFRFSPVILHPKSVKCLDLGGQGMQPGREPALSCSLWWAPDSTMHRSVLRPISLGLSLQKMSPWSPSFLIPLTELGTFCYVGKSYLLKHGASWEPCCTAFTCGWHAGQG